MFACLFLFLASSSFEMPMTPWGADCELCIKSSETKKTEKALKPIVKGCISMIRFYQKQISPIDGPRSHFYPSSSQYTLLAIQKYGVCKGIALGCDRLMRENRDDWVYSYKNETLKLDLVR